MRLIDADALEISTEFSDDGEYSWDVVPAFRIRSAPTIDAVEVVRCKDCKFCKSTFDGEHDFCTVWDAYESETAYVTDTDFCSYGERREDG